MSLLHAVIKIENTRFEMVCKMVLLIDTMTLSPLLIQQFRLIRKSGPPGIVTVCRSIEEDIIS